MSETRPKIFYLMSGPAHLPYLVVSLSTLRIQNVHIPVDVYAYPESIDLVREIARDPRLHVTPIEWQPSRIGKNSQFIEKIRVAQQLRDPVAVYLDADTMVRRPIEQMTNHAVNANIGFLATQFNDWSANKATIRKRTARLSTVEGIDQGIIQKYHEQAALPSVNGGIWVCRPQTASGRSVLEVWEAWTRAAIDIFIPDETVLHVMQAYFSERDFQVLRGGAWNCSPKYRPQYITNAEVAIWHFHGDSNVRPAKSDLGWRLWWPEFTKAYLYDLGGMQSWLSKIENSNLRQMIAEKKAQLNPVPSWV